MELGQPGEVDELVTPVYISIFTILAVRLGRTAAQAAWLVRKSLARAYMDTLERVSRRLFNLSARVSFTMLEGQCVSISPNTEAPPSFRYGPP